MNYLKLSLNLISVFSPFIYFFKNNFLKLFLFIVFLFIIIYKFSMRSLQTPDTKAYEYMFYNINSNEVMVERLEPLFKLILKISLICFNNFRVFLFFITTFYFFSWIKITKFFVNNIIFIFGTFFITYGTYFFGITLRQALAFIVAYYGIKVIIINKNAKKGFLFIAISSFIHSSMILYIFCIYISKFKIKSKYLNILLFLSFFTSFFSEKSLVLLKIIEFIINKFNLIHYKAYLTSDTGISLNTIYFTVQAFLFLNHRNKIKNKTFEYNFFLNLFIIGVLILNILNIFKGVSRMADIFLVFYSILLCIIFENIIKNRNKIFFIIILSGNNLLLLLISIKNLSEFYK
ncbi:MAG: EpsG family protein [Fusobacteriaceae bacterium]